jgi:hypothetical protein
VSVEPTGATITWTGNTIFRIECDRLTEQWPESDTLSVFDQLGVIEWPPAAGIASGGLAGAYPCSRLPVGPSGYPDRRSWQAKAEC